MNYYSLIPSAPSYNPTAFSSCCRISSANHCGYRTLMLGPPESIRPAVMDAVFPGI